MHFEEKNILIVLAMASLLSLSVKGQSFEEDNYIEQMIELNADLFGENFDFMELSEQLEYYRRYPIDLNATDGEDLRKLGFLTSVDIQNLLDHRAASGAFLSIFELQAVRGFDLGLVQLLGAFVSVGESRSLRQLTAKRLWVDGEHDLMFRYGRVLQEQVGYTIDDETRSRYLGSPDRLFLRYRYHLGRDLQISVNMKKDAGEQFFAGAQRYGFDFYSASVQLRNQGRLKDLVIGDYALQFGQGLAMWNGLAFGKSVVPQQIARSATGLRAYTSANEVLFLRGASAVIALNKRIHLTPFVSWRHLDGSVQAASDTALIVGSLGQTGLHRTPTEIANKRAIQQWVYGINTEYRKRHVRLGYTMFHTRFDGVIQPQDVLRNRFAFSGDQLTNMSLYYNYGYRGFYLFGEAAHQLGAGFAFVNGAVSSLTPQLSLVLLYRDYHRDYHSFFNQGVAEGTSANNERGFFSGLVYHPNRKIEWMFYADVFRFPWLRYRVDAPSRGVDVMTQFSYNWYRRARVLLRYRYRHRQENERFDLPENRLVDVFRQQVRADGQYKLNENWMMRDRVELMHYDKESNANELGWLAYHDIIYNPMAGRFTANGRIAWFSVPSYDSRIYAYENDVLYSYSFPVYQHTGARLYANIRIKLMQQTDLWLRYATFVYRDIDEIGSGLERIAGNMRSDIRVQMRVRF